MLNGEGKRELRLSLKEKRAALSVELRASADQCIAQRVCALPEFAAADVVFTYLSFGSEVDTRQIIQEAWRAGKTVAIPRCVPGERRMEWCEAHSFDGLVKSSLGVEEPRADAQSVPMPISASVPASVPSCAIALVPALAYDQQGYRLGYGGGYYDVFLEAFAGTSIGLCREGFLLDSLDRAIEPHDLPVDIVITDANTLRRCE